MASINRVILLGNVGRDPELRYTPDGQAVANFSLCTNERVKRGTEVVDEPTWHKIAAFGRIAEVAEQYVKKGGLVAVEGRIAMRKFTDKEGAERTSFEIVCLSLQLCGGPREGSAGGRGPVPDDSKRSAPGATAGGGRGAPPAGGIADMADDVPF